FNLSRPVFFPKFYDLSDLSGHLERNLVFVRPLAHWTPVARNGKQSANRRILPIARANQNWNDARLPLFLQLYGPPDMRGIKVFVIQIIRAEHQEDNLRAIE